MSERCANSALRCKEKARQGSASWRSGVVHEVLKASCANCASTQGTGICRDEGCLCKGALRASFHMREVCEVREVDERARRAIRMRCARCEKSAESEVCEVRATLHARSRREETAREHFETRRSEHVHIFCEHQSVRAAGVNERVAKVFRRPGSHISRTKAQQAITLSLHGGRYENVRISCGCIFLGVRE